jgi:hypothetical protein
MGYMEELRSVSANAEGISELARRWEDTAVTAEMV